MHNITINLTVISEETPNRLAAYYERLIVHDSERGAEHPRVANVAVEVVGPEVETCDECGAKGVEVIGCPDGAKICRECFEMRAN